MGSFCRRRRSKRSGPTRLARLRRRQHPYLEFGLPLKIGRAFHKPEIDLMQKVYETR